MTRDTAPTRLKVGRKEGIIMVTDKEMQNCKRQLVEIYGEMNEDELRDKMTNVMDIIADLHKRSYAKSAAGDVWGVDVVNRLIHSAHVQMATLEAMLEEAEGVR